MNKSWFPIVVVLAVVVGAAMFVRQYGSRQPAPAGLEGNALESSPSDEREVSPTGAIPLVSGIQLAVTSPSGNVTVSSPSFTVRGKTVAGGEVFVNDSETKADSSGNFSATLTLDEGENYILVVANDAFGNYAEKEFTVTYSP
ncbi:MAG TPA: hypothetical protein VJB96_03645 [Patescibacteria group bacterium]|nr:hypothetical protein [Patescibacteria group bacterium]